MIVKRGEIWLAALDPVRGSEQAGTRPVLIFQSDAINAHTTTVLTIPLTTNLRRAALPSCVRLAKGDGGLAHESVALCHQLRVLDKSRLLHKLGAISRGAMVEIERCALQTMGYF